MLNQITEGTKVQAPWVLHYQSGVPATIDPKRYTSLADFFISSCDKYAQHEAFESFGTVISYQTLKQKSLAFASFLQQSGLKKGDRVGIMMPNLLQYPIAIFGILCAGGIVVNTNPLYTAAEATFQLSDAGIDFLLLFNRLSSSLAEALYQLPIKKIILVDVGDCLPMCKRFLIHTYLNYKKQFRVRRVAHSLTFDEALTMGQQTAFVPIELTQADIAFLQYTGGTTGTPKGAMLSHGNMVANVLQAYTWVSSLKIGPKDCVVTALPLYHIFALNANCLTFLMAGAKNILITNPRDIKSLIRTIQSKGFTVFTGVNTLFNALLNHPGFSRVDFSKVKLTLSGGMALQKTIAEKWHQLTHSRILEAYGLTETSPAVTITPMYVEHYNGSIGLPLPSTVVSIRDEDNQEVRLGEVGELCVKGPQVMQGYWHHPEETAAIFTADGFLKTGDLVKMDEKGFLYLVDRKKDLIIVSGFNVYPTEVERVISKHPAVLEVGVCRMLDESGNERVQAFVVKRHAEVTATELIAYCRQYLTPYKVPKKIQFRDSLPKTAVGKILRRALQEPQS